MPRLRPSCLPRAYSRSFSMAHIAATLRDVWSSQAVEAPLRGDGLFGSRLLLSGALAGTGSAPAIVEAGFSDGDMADCAASPLWYLSSSHLHLVPRR